MSSDKTNPSTPNAKKSSGQWTLNLDGAICGRVGCNHRRDMHETKNSGSHRWHCNAVDCACAEFVIGGPDLDYERLADTEQE